MVPAPENEEFAVGSIVRMRLKNFLTYDNVEFHPGPNLNVIIGPNGTGKSSIVCAICLGLGGNASVLGRASDMREYVQHGKKTAEILIELKGKGQKNIVIQFKIKKEGSNEFLVDGKKSTKTKVLELVRGYRIQVDNLCQFLAQDKVTEFARIKKQALLENTEKAVATDLLELHEKLKEKQGSGSSMKEELDKLEKEKKTVESDLAELEPQYRAFHERQTREDHVQMLEKKKDYLDYEENRKILMKMKEDKKGKVEELNRKKEAVGPAQTEWDQLKREVERKGAELERVKADLDGVTDRAEKYAKDADEVDDKIDRVYSELERKMKDQQEKQTQISKWETQVENLKRQITELPETTNLQPEIDGIGEEMQKKQDEMENLQSTIEATRTERNRLQLELNAVRAELRRQEDKMDIRLRTLKRLGPQGDEAAKLWAWYQDHKDQFQQPIYVPLLELNLTHPKEAKFVETVVAERDLTMFICGNKADNERLMAAMKANNFRTNVTVAPSNLDIRAKEVPSALKRLGFRCFVSDLVTGPAPVIQYLSGISGISAVPVGTEKTERQLDDVTKAMIQLKIGTALTENKRLGAKLSKYTGDPITSDNALKQGGLLAQNIEEQGDERGDLMREYKDMQTRLDKLSSEESERKLMRVGQEREALRSKKTELTDSHRRRGMMKQQKAKLERQLGDERREIVDLSEEKKKVQATCRKYVDKKLKLMEETAKMLTELEPRLERCTELSLVKAKKLRLAELKSQEVKAANAALRELQETVVDLTSEIEVKNRELSAQRDGLCKRCGLPSKFTPRNPAEKRELDEFFESLKALPKKVEEIEAKINEERGRMAAAKGVNDDIVNEFEDKRDQLVALQKRLEKTQLLVASWSSDVSKMKKMWLGRLESVTANISQHFSDFFSKLGCAGEVVIDKEDGEENFANYGIGINVKFRDSEQMTRLSHDRHSGGERSVATMLYMLALQELSEVPFRCVDEINQGMDADNERTVFEMVVDLLSGSDERKNLGRTQYFMLTPKLLPNLTFSRKMAVQIVHNGSGMLPGDQWNIEKFIQNKKESVRS